LFFSSRKPLSEKQSQNLYRGFARIKGRGNYCGIFLGFKGFNFSQEAKAFRLPVLSRGSGGIVPGFSGARFRRVLLEGLALAALTRIRSHNNIVRSSHEVGRSMGDMAGVFAFLQPFDPGHWLNFSPVYLIDNKCDGWLSCEAHSDTCHFSACVSPGMAKYARYREFFSQLSKKRQPSPCCCDTEIGRRFVKRVLIESPHCYFKGATSAVFSAVAEPARAVSDCVRR
jgi:hypothetical protein